MANCPICGRHIGEFTNDPLLTTPSLSTDEFKGFTTLITTHITELQIERHQQEIDNGITPLTEFTPINNTGFFQNIKPYIQELRDSTEKILVTTGQTLAEFLSTDEDGNPMTSKSDWTDSNLEEIKYQCKAIHIEDLRHFIGIAYFRENWEDSSQIIINWPASGVITGQDSKAWSASFFVVDLGSFIQITAIQDILLYGVPSKTDSSTNTVRVNYYNTSEKRFKFRDNSILKFDINQISIPNNVTASPPHYSFDNFFVQVSIRSFDVPIVEYYLTYFFNYDPTNFIEAISPSPYTILKGTIGVGTQSINISDDYNIKYPNFTKYYDGTISTKGFYVDGYQTGMGHTAIISQPIHKVEIDNILIKP